MLLIGQHSGQLLINSWTNFLLFLVLWTSYGESSFLFTVLIDFYFTYLLFMISFFELQSLRIDLLCFTQNCFCSFTIVSSKNLKGQLLSSAFTGSVCSSLHSCAPTCIVRAEDCSQRYLKMVLDSDSLRYIFIICISDLLLCLTC